MVLAIKRKKSLGGNAAKKSKYQKEVYNEVLFLKGLKDPNLKFAALDKFVVASKAWEENGEGYDIVSGYCRVSKDCSSVLQVLETGNRKHSELNSVFGVLEEILLRVIEDKKEYASVGQHIVNTLLSSHMESIYVMINPERNPVYCRRTWKLLSTMVLVGENCAKSIIACFDFSHYYVQKLLRPKETKVSAELRTGLLHFILSFLLLDNDFVIRLLIDVKGLLAKIVEGVHLYPLASVPMLLSTLQEKIIRNPAISKTQKIHVFSIDGLRQIGSLYRLDDGTTKSVHMGVLPSQDEEEKKIIEDTVHKLLLDICCSYKHGIVFSDKTMGFSGRNENSRISVFLGTLVNSITNPLVQDLVVKTLKECPDQIHHFIITFIKFNPLTPKPSTKWIGTVNVITQIYDAQFKRKSVCQFLSDDSVILAVDKMLVPALPNQQIQQMMQQSLRHESMLVRHYGMLLLHTCLKNCVSLMQQTKSEVPKLLKVISEEKFIEIQRIMKEKVLKAIPEVKVMFNCWQKSLEQANSEIAQSSTNSMEVLPDVTILDQLITIQQALCTLQEFSPSVFSHCVDDLGEMFARVCLMKGTLSQLMHSEPGLDDNLTANLPEQYMLKLLSGTDTRRLNWSKKYDGHLLMFLLLESLWHHRDSHIVIQSCLIKLMMGTGLFESHEMELVVWFRNLMSIQDPDARVTIINFLSQVFTTYISNPYPYVEKAQEYASKSLTWNASDRNNIEGMEKVGNSLLNAVRDMEDDSSDEIQVEDDDTDCTYRTPYSPLTIVAMEMLLASSKQPKEITMYLNGLMVDLLHIQCDPVPLIYMMKDLGKPLIKQPISDYAVCLISENKNVNLKKILGIKQHVFGDFDMSFKLAYLWNETIASKRSELEKSLLENLASHGIDIQLLVRQILLYIHLTLTQKKEVNPDFVAFGWSLIKKIIHSLSQKQISITTGTSTEDIALPESSISSTEEVPIMTDINPPCKFHKSNPTQNEEKSVFFDVVKEVLEHPTSRDNFLFKVTDSAVTIERALLNTTYFCQCFDMDLTKSIDIHSTLEYYFSRIVTFMEEVRDFKEDVLKALNMFLKHCANAMNRKSMMVLLNVFMKYITQKLSNGQVGTGVVELLTEIILHLMMELKNLEHKLVIEPCTDIRNFFQLLSNPSLHLKPLTQVCLRIIEDEPSMVGLVSSEVIETCLSSKSTLQREFAEKVLSQNVRLRKWFHTWVIKHKFKKEEMLFILPCIKCLVQKVNTQTHKESNTDELRQKVISLYKDKMDVYHGESRLQLYDVWCMFLQQGDLDINIQKKLVKSVTRAMESVDGIEVDTVRMLDELCRHIKASDLRCQLISLCLTSLVTVLKSSSEEKRTKCGLLLKCLTMFEENDYETHCDSTLRTTWPYLAKTLLRYTFDDAQCLRFIQKLGCVVWKQDTGATPGPRMLYEMIHSHSSFLSIMLDAKHVYIKEALLEFLVLLVQKEPECCKVMNIRVLFGAYNASLCFADLKILQLLQIYESNKYSLQEYRPYLWGSKAVEYFSNSSSSGKTLSKVPTTEQVIDCFQVDRLKLSSERFPVHRKYDVLLSENTDEHSTEETAYDPCFVLPLLCTLTSTESLVDCRHFIETGCLSYVVAALSCYDNTLRGAAYHILTSYHTQLQTAKFPEKEQVLFLMNLLRNSVSKANLRLPCIITAFLSQMASLMLHPEEYMYKVLNSFLLLKPTLNLFDVPEFYKLFNSPELEYKKERNWILTLLLSGLRESSDYQIFEKRYLFKLLLAYHDSSINDTQSQVLVLKILQKACKVKKLAKQLVEKHGILSWIYGVLNSSVIDCKRADSLTQILQDLSVSIKESYSTEESLSDSKYRKLISKCRKMALVLTTFIKQYKESDISSLTKTLKSIIDFADHVKATKSDGESFLDPLLFNFKDVRLHLQISESN